MKGWLSPFFNEKVRAKEKLQFIIGYKKCHNLVFERLRCSQLIHIVQKKAFIWLELDQFFEQNEQPANSPQARCRQVHKQFCFGKFYCGCL